MFASADMWEALLIMLIKNSYGIDDNSISRNIHFFIEQFRSKNFHIISSGNVET